MVRVTDTQTIWTINKAQGQSLKVAGIDLNQRERQPTGKITNVVYKEALLKKELLLRCTKSCGYWLKPTGKTTNGKYYYNALKIAGIDLNQRERQPTGKIRTRAKLGNTASTYIKDKSLCVCLFVRKIPIGQFSGPIGFRHVSWKRPIGYTSI